MPDASTTPNNDLFPKDPSYEYGNVLPLRQRGIPYANAMQPELALPDIIRQPINAISDLLQVPGEAYRGQLSAPGALESAGIRAGLEMIGTGMPADMLAGPEGSAMGMVRGYHGTPYRFEPIEGDPFGKFSNEAIGSGEGAQVYGWGHYVAGNPAVAEQYQRSLSGPMDIQHGDQTFSVDEIRAMPDSPKRTALIMAHQMGPEAARSSLEQNPVLPGDKAAAKWLADNEGKVSLVQPGSLYHVAIKPDEEELLDWDKPFSQQSQQVQDRLKQMNLPLSKYGWKQGVDIPMPEAKGGDIYEEAAVRYAHRTGGRISYNENIQGASQDLHEAGIPGIKYLDQGSRNMTAPADYADDRMSVQQMHGLHLINRAGQGSRWEQGEPADYHGNLLSNFAQTLKYSDPKYISGGVEGLKNDIAALESLDPKKLIGPPRTRNYVIFDPSNLRITGRNGQILEPIHHDPFSQSATPIEHDPFQEPKK